MLSTRSWSLFSGNRELPTVSKCLSSVSFRRASALTNFVRSVSTWCNIFWRAVSSAPTNVEGLNGSDRLPPHEIAAAKNVREFHVVLFKRTSYPRFENCHAYTRNNRRHRPAQNLVNGRSLSEVSDLGWASDVGRCWKYRVLHCRPHQDIWAQP